MPKFNGAPASVPKLHTLADKYKITPAQRQRALRLSEEEAAQVRTRLAESQKKKDEQDAKAEALRREQSKRTPNIVPSPTHSVRTVLAPRSLYQVPNVLGELKAQQDNFMERQEASKEGCCSSLFNCFRGPK